MAHQRGSTVVFKLGYELAGYGTPATAAYILPINSFDVTSRRELHRAATLQSGRNPTQPFAGNLSVEGTITVPVDSLAMPYWLIAMFGLPTTTGSSSPYTHTFKVPPGQRSLTLETSFPDLASAKYQRFVGCKVSSFAMTVGGDGELVATIGVMGQQDSMQSATFHTGTSVSLARLNHFQAAIQEGGSSLATATELSITIGFPMDPYYVIGGGGVVGSLAERQVEVSGNIKALFDSTTLLDKALAGTESSLRLTVTGSATSIFELQIPELVYERRSVPVPGPQGLLVDLNFQGYYDNDAGASGIIAVVKNPTASYASV